MCGEEGWWDYWGAEKYYAQQAAITPYYYGGMTGCGQCQCNLCGMCSGIVCQQPCCSTCCGSQKKLRKRICNATEDDTFDVAMFSSNTTYYEGCDCVVFTNCTNTT
jgi:hypothetical protein